MASEPDAPKWVRDADPESAYLAGYEDGERSLVEQLETERAEHEFTQRRLRAMCSAYEAAMGTPYPMPYGTGGNLSEQFPASSPPGSIHGQATLARWARNDSESAVADDADTSGSPGEPGADSDPATSSERSVERRPPAHSGSAPESSPAKRPT